MQTSTMLRGKQALKTSRIGSTKSFARPGRAGSVSVSAKYKVVDGVVVLEPKSAPATSAPAAPAPAPVAVEAPPAAVVEQAPEAASPVAAVTDVLDNTGDAAVAAASAAVDAASDAAAAAADAAAAAADAAAEAAAAAQAAAEEAAAAASGLVSGAAGAVSDLTDSITGSVTGLTDSVTEGVSSLTSSVGSSVSEVTGAAGQAVGDALGAVGGAVSTVTDTVGSTLSATTSAVGSTLKQVADTIDATTTSVSTTTSALVQGVESSVAATTAAVWGAVPAPAQEALVQAGGAVGSAASFAAEYPAPTLVLAGAVVVPAAVNAYKARYGGYAGELAPQAVSELLAGEEPALLLDVRPEAARKADGLPELKLGARFKAVALPVSVAAAQVQRATPAPVMRGVRSRDELTLQVYAAFVANLRQVATPLTKVVVMDREDSEAARAVARALRAEGLFSAYVAADGYKGWVGAGLPVTKERGVEYDASAADLISDNIEVVAKQAGALATRLKDPQVAVPVASTTAVGAVALYNYHVTLQLIALAGMGITLYTEIDKYGSLAGAVEAWKKALTPKPKPAQTPVAKKSAPPPPPKKAAAAPPAGLPPVPVFFKAAPAADAAKPAAAPAPATPPAPAAPPAPKAEAPAAPAPAAPAASTNGNGAAPAPPKAVAPPAEAATTSVKQ
uniref:Rhodanese domain-containing protein n=1 Tax=Chlamydomonas leiostraca TaxID=1034604 RepID=A0A6T8TBB3_9CHLO|mmetsp:Transcript_29988/g.76354  ORF Transcript_29988/g.76354 Transcript_29988/m.76354 type:complete len:675 (+) Transcript_29988:96-2120(+)